MSAVLSFRAVFWVHLRVVVPNVRLFGVHFRVVVLKVRFFCDLALKSRFLDIFAKNFGSWSKVPLVIRFSNLGTQSCFRVIDYGIQSRFWDVDIQSRFWYIDIQSHFVGSSSACHFLLIECLLVLIVQADSASWVKPACRLRLAQSAFCLISIAFVIFFLIFWRLFWVHDVISVCCHRAGSRLKIAYNYNVMSSWVQ